MVPQEMEVNEVHPEKLENQVKLERQDHRELQEHQEAKDHQDCQEHQDSMVKKEMKETKEKMDALDPAVHQEVLELPVNLVHKDPSEHPV